MSIKSPLNRQFGTQFDSVFDVVKSNPMYDKSGGKIPSLDLNFAKSKSLSDSISTKNLITFIRASSGTYVDSDGLIKTSPVNKLLYSNEFTNNAWTKFRLTLVSYTTTAPDGTATATTFSTQNTAYIYQDTSSVIGESYVNSIWIKGNANATLGLRKPGTSNTQIGNGSESLNVTTEWQKFTAVTTSADNTIGRFLLDFRSSNGASVPAGLEVSLWHAQTEEGTTSSDYLPTGGSKSGAPRFDHDPVTGESLGLLIEEERTNYISDQSPSFNKGSSNTTITYDAFTAPDGSNSAIRVQGNNGFIQISSGVNSVPAGSTLTASFYVYSSVEIPNFRTRMGYGSSHADTIKTIPANKWTRFICDAITDDTGTDTTFAFRPLTTINSFGVANVDCYIWGFQVEAGSFPTSYIPTSGSSVTRSPDIASIEGNEFAKTNLLEYSERFDQSAWLKQTSVTLTPNSIAAPDGTTTATLYSISAATQRAVDQDISSLTDGTACVFSIYIKTIVDTVFKIRDSGGSVLFDAQILAADGWQRIQVPFTKNSSKLGFFDNSGNTGNRFYIWGAQLETGELTEYTPSVESFVSRASSATYVDDATGLIKTTPVNLYFPSTPTTAAWSSPSSFTETDNYGIAPDGTNSSLRVTTTGSGYLQDGTPDDLEAGTTYTLSVYIKLEIVRSTYFRIGVQGSAVNSASFKDVISELVVGQWVRVFHTFTADNNAVGTLRLMSATNADAEFWGVQLEKGSTATDLIPTYGTISAAARYENGELLLEEARTNKMRRSEKLTGSNIWQSQDGATSSLSNITSPDGVSKMWLVDLSALAGTPGAGSRFYQGSLAFNNVVNTFSFYARSVSGTGTFPVGYFDGSNYIKSYVTLTEETQRYEISCPAGLSSANSNIFGFTRRGLTHDETLTQAYVWGCQVEAAPYASSYIPTDSTSGGITRAADVSTSALGVDSWYNQSEGTVFSDVLPLSADSLRAYVFSNGTVDKRIAHNVDASNIYNLFLKSGGVTTSLAGNISGLPKPLKAGLAYKSESSRGVIDGVLKTLSSTIHVPNSINQLSLGSQNFSADGYLNGHISHLAYFTTRLPDDKLKSITT